MLPPALTPGSTAVITGAAAGIGLAMAERFAGLGLRVCLADLGADRLERAAERVAAAATGGAADVMTSQTDIAQVDQVRQLEAAVRERFGGTDVLVNNAACSPAVRCSGLRRAGARCLGSTCRVSSTAARPSCLA